jgi:hypothetical protein
MPEVQNRFVVISALGIFEILAWGSSFYLPAVLAAPIVRDTGWPLPWIVGALSAGLLVAGLASPRIGRTIGRHGGRPVLAGAALLLALGLTGLALASSIPMVFAAWLVIGLGMGAGLYDAAFATLGRLYGAAARPAITTLTLWGGFASTLCWPLSAYLVAHLGWRGACLTYAAIHIAVSLPLALVLIPRAPALPPPPAKGQDTAGDATRSERRALLLLGAMGVVTGTISAAISVHLLTILQDRGLALAAAVALGTVVGPAQVGARVLEMAGRGRHHPVWTLTAATALTAAGLALLWTGWLTAAVALVLYGAGNGLNSIAKGTVPLALFGPHRYAALVGTLAMPSLLAQALAPSLFSVILARYGATTTLAVLVALAGAGIAILGGLWLNQADRPTLQSLPRNEPPRPGQP